MASLIGSLRDLVPLKPLTPAQGLDVGERQARRLLALSHVNEPPVPDSVVADIPRVQVERAALGPVSGAAEWSHGRWLILINSAEPPGRQRFSLAHEFKHVLDNPFVKTLYPLPGRGYDRQRAEQLCDHFAACLLMPRAWIVELWTVGVRNPQALASRFRVSPTAMQVRLRGIGLVQPWARPSRDWTRGRSR